MLSAVAAPDQAVSTALMSQPVLTLSGNQPLVHPQIFTFPAWIATKGVHEKSRMKGLGGFRQGKAIVSGVAVSGHINARRERRGPGGKFSAVRRDNERGAQLIEFALILPILISLLLGIVTGGIAFSHNLSIDNAARETARFAATLPVNNNMGAYLNQIADVAINTSTGTLDDGVPNRVVCVAYVHPDGVVAHDQTTRLVEDAAGVRTVSNQPCIADGRPNDERRVQITVARDADLVVFYFTRTVNLTGQSVARFERGDA